jgi:hypothetical protein
VSVSVSVSESESVSVSVSESESVSVSVSAVSTGAGVPKQPVARKAKAERGKSFMMMSPRVTKGAATLPAR